MQPVSRCLPLALCVLLLASGGRAHALSSQHESEPRAMARDTIQLAQLFGQQRREENASELVERIGRLEGQIRQLTGMVEELQHRNQTLEQQLRRIREDTDFRFQEMNPSGRPQPPRGQSSLPPPAGSPPGLPPAGTRPMPPIASAPDANVGAPGRRPDVFDPSTAPNAPGAPRPLGTIPGGNLPGPNIMTDPDEPPRRGQPGAPMDLGARGAPPGDLGPPRGLGNVPPGGPIGQQAVLAPSGSARDEYDLAYGAIQRRDYDLADQGFRAFLVNHPNDRLVPEAHYWLGESQFQRQQYNDSAETFLDLYNKYPNSLKAPEALLRLGQSLAALGKAEAACASLGAVLSKYPKASANVKRSVEQEQKRARC